MESITKSCLKQARLACNCLKTWIELLSNCVSINTSGISNKWCVCVLTNRCVSFFLLTGDPWLRYKLFIFSAGCSVIREADKMHFLLHTRCCLSLTVSQTWDHDHKRSCFVDQQAKCFSGRQCRQGPEGCCYYRQWKTSYYPLL